MSVQKDFFVLGVPPLLQMH